MPSLRDLDELELDRRLTFFIGENGSGKSTLLKAIARAYGFGPEGGSRHIRKDTTAKNAATAPLADALRLAFPDARILSFDDGAIRETRLEDTALYATYRTLLADPARFMERLLAPEDAE